MMLHIFSDIVVDTIRQKQLKQGVSNYTLAQKSQLSEAALSYIFNHRRRPTLYTLKMISDALGLSLSEIIAEVEVSENKD